MAGPEEKYAPHFGSATLTDCDREPIHIPGSIQPHGCLVVLGRDERSIVQYAGDLEAMFGVILPEPLGAPITALIDEAGAELIRAAASLPSAQRPSARPPSGLARAEPVHAYEFEIAAAAGPIDAVVHRSGGLVVVEFERAARAVPTVARNAMLGAVPSMLVEIQAAETLPEYYQACAEQVRRLTGFDRVMVYRFLEDGSGKVVAEDKHEALDSYLDLHYPESDIPKQARALYRDNWLRLIPDAAFEPAPLIPRLNPETGAELDLGYAVLRSVSPIHTQYLRNMGVAASMSISILQKGELWGLIACHHREPRYISGEVRAACEIYGQLVSPGLEARRRAEENEYRLQQRSVLQQLVAQLSKVPRLADGLIRTRPNLLDLIRADGVALWVEGEYAELGLVPPRSRVQRLIRLLDARKREDAVFASNEVGRDLPEAGAVPEMAGVLALSVSRSQRDYVFWFRREIVDTVSWGGNPREAIVRAGDSLGPRRSFAVWRETMRGRSRPWKAVEREAARELRVAILEIVLQRIDEIARERAAAQERQGLLLGELDHRVKNTLVSIQAVMRHTRRSHDSIDGYVAALEGRIRSMAHAQSLLSENRWRGASLKALVEEELRHYEAAQIAIDIEGDTLFLKPKAALALSMVIHELATNAAKYGALSVAGGRLGLAWWRAGDSLRLSWREERGPPVMTPTRHGFGRTIIESSLSYELGGSVELRFEPTGVECDISVPWPRAVGGEAAVQAPAAARPAETAGLGVLLVEDSLVTALDLSERLRDFGCTVFGPTGRIEEALALVEQEPIDLAILDINLGEEDSFPIADRLQAKGVPFLFLSGYDAGAALPKRHADAVCISKPVYDPALLEAIAAATGRGGG